MTTHHDYGRQRFVLDAAMASGHDGAPEMTEQSAPWCSACLGAPNEPARPCEHPAACGSSRGSVTTGEADGPSPADAEFGEGWGANLRLVRRDGVVVVQLRCPDCQRWADIDDDQLHGRVSVDHTPGCGYHETHDWYALAVDESGRIPVHIDGDGVGGAA